MGPRPLTVALAGVWGTASTTQRGGARQYLCRPGRGECVPEQCLEVGKIGRGEEGGSGSGRVEVEFQWYCPMSVDHSDNAMSDMDCSGCGACDRVVVDSWYAGVES